MNDYEVSPYEVRENERITDTTPTVKEELLASRLLSESLAIHLTGHQLSEVADALLDKIAGRLTFGDGQDDTYWSDGVLAALFNLTEKLRAPFDDRSEAVA